MKQVLPAIFTVIAIIAAISAALVLKSAWGGPAMTGGLLFAGLLVLLAALCILGRNAARRAK